MRTLQVISPRMTGSRSRLANCIGDSSWRRGGRNVRQRFAAVYTRRQMEGRGMVGRGWARFLPLAILLLGLAAFFALGLEHQVTLAALKAHRDALEAYVHAHPLLAAAMFAVAYIAIVACSIPAGTPMTIAAGFLFGVWEGAEVGRAA